MDVAFDNDLGYLPEKEVMIEKIDSQGDSAAAVVCKILKEQNSDFLKDIIGVVALLGTVQTNELGRSPILPLYVTLMSMQVNM